MTCGIRERDRHQHIFRHFVVKIKINTQTIEETRVKSDIQRLLFFPGQIVILHGRNSKILTSVIVTRTDQT